MKKQAGTTHFFYQNGILATVIQPGQHHAIFRNADVPLAEHITGQDSSLLKVDRSGSVLGVSTDSDDHCYSAYGHDSSQPSARTLTRFNGERLEVVAAAYLLGNGYRLFSPGQMRFNSPDSQSPFGAGGYNSYAYCSADPVNRIDPSGDMSVYTLIKSLIKFGAFKGRTTPPLVTNGKLINAPAPSNVANRPVLKVKGTPRQSFTQTAQTTALPNVPMLPSDPIYSTPVPIRRLPSGPTNGVIERLPVPAETRSRPVASISPNQATRARATQQRRRSSSVSSVSSRDSTPPGSRPSSPIQGQDGVPYYVQVRTDARNHPDYSRRYYP